MPLRLRRRSTSDALVGLADVVGDGLRLADHGAVDVRNCIRADKTAMSVGRCKADRVVPLLLVAFLPSGGVPSQELYPSLQQLFEALANHG